MALISKASLLMVPSTYEQEKLYNVLPSGNRAPDNKGGAGYDQTRADFTFDRGSNAAATRIDENGVLQKYRENLFTNSNMFTGISLDGITRTTAQADPFGGSNAVLFTENTNTGTHRWYNTTSITSSAVYTISVFAKANGVTDLQIAGAAGIIGRFDLSTGEAFTSGIGIDAKIESIGTDGWYRCSATYNGGGWIGLYLAQGTSISYTGDGTSGVYAYGYQVEKSLVATDYLDSGATTGKAGVLIDLPRINYDANGENGSLLLEPSRSNLVTNSEYTGAYLKSNITATSNEAASPEGVNNATKIETTDTGQCHMRAAFTAATGNYTGSVFIKKQDFDYIYMEMGGAYAWFNINTGAKGNGNKYGSDWAYVDHSIEDYGNGWYRCILIGNCLTAGAYTFRSIQPVAGNGSYNSNLSGGITYWYGAQLEAGSYVSSYIPNHGESGGVTRAADSMPYNNDIPVTGSAWTVCFELDLKQTELASNVQKMALRHSDSTVYQTWRLFTKSTVYHCFVPYFNVDAEYPFSTNTDNNRTDNGKVVMSANGFGTFKLFTRFNGTTTTQTVTGKSNFSARKYQMNVDAHKMGVAKVMFFDEALSDSECQSLVE